MVSSSEASYIIESCFSDFRLDGRSRLEHRPYTVSNNNNSNSSFYTTLILSNGSSRIYLPGSSTDILCSVKADLVHPSPCKPYEGIVELNVDLSLCGSSSSAGIVFLERRTTGGMTTTTTTSQRRKEREAESQITSLLQRLILPHAVNYTQLVILPGKYVWRLSIDIIVLRCDGCIFDACSLALREGLQNTKLPKVQSAVSMMEEGSAAGRNVQQNNIMLEGSNSSSSTNDLIVDGDIHNAMPPPGIENCPLIVTVSILSTMISPPITTVADTTPPLSLSSPPHRQQQQQQQQPPPPRRRHRQYTSIIDARAEEEVCASSHICVSVDPNGMVCGVHTLGGCGITTTTTTNNNNTMTTTSTTTTSDSHTILMGDNNLEDNDDDIRVSTMPWTILSDVVATAVMASKNMYSSLNDQKTNRGRGMIHNNNNNNNNNKDSDGYEYLLKNHILFQ